MRVIAGFARGRGLVSPPGHATRPTADRVREAMFNLLGADIVAGARVLDAFAGTGALGIEALSRGAATAVFFERDPAALAAIHTNLSHTGLDAAATVLNADALSPPAVVGGAGVSVVFVDPPYGRGLVASALWALGAGGWLAPGAIAAVEMASANPEGLPPGWAILQQRRYGATVLVIARLT